MDLRLATLAMSHPVLLVALLIFLVNLPFGYWRAGLRKLSLPWFVAIHAPVLVAIWMRHRAGLPFRWLTLPLFVLAFFLGQSAGGRIRRARMGPRVSA